MCHSLSKKVCIFSSSCKSPKYKVNDLKFIHFMNQPCLCFTFFFNDFFFFFYQCLQMASVQGKSREKTGSIEWVRRKANKQKSPHPALTSVVSSALVFLDATHQPWGWTWKTHSFFFLTCQTQETQTAVYVVSKSLWWQNNFFQQWPNNPTSWLTMDLPTVLLQKCKAHFWRNFPEQ